MVDQQLPEHYQHLQSQFPEIMSVLGRLGTTVHNAGPISEKDAELIQLAAAAAIQSEGSVHSHARRAMQAGASKEEVHHSLLLLISTIGFPRVSAAISWVQDLI